MSLRDRLVEEIAAHGPLTIARYMTACLHDPQDGYYATRPALGEGGDFITAPLVSQMFGELIGLWAVEVWRRLGSPPAFRLVEAGPGDGTLMSDMLRAARLEPAFLAAADVWLVEVSAPLRARQAYALADLAPVRWAERLADIPTGLPTLLVANELLDCLPIRQFVKTAKGWAERVVGVKDGALAFGLAGPTLELGHADAAQGSVLETSAAQWAFGAEVGDRLAADWGAALLIDYGRDTAGFGDTLQALRRHRKTGPLDAPGEDDLTVHADFPAVAAAARARGVDALLAAQGEFLRRLGLDERAAILSARTPAKADVIGRQRDRLAAPDQMGDLFKALCLYAPATLAPPGFEET